MVRCPADKFNMTNATISDPVRAERIDCPEHVAIHI